MALDTERSEEHPLNGGLAALKSGASDGIGLIAGAGRRLVQASRAAAAASASGDAAVLALIKRKSSAARSKLAAFATAPGSFGPLARWFRRQPIVRFFSASLLRRILISNLIGFFILLGGILYLGWFHTWLIDAKLDALKTQGKIIADAIAANATVVREHIVLDPNKLPDTPDAQQQFPDDGLAALELSIHPEEVTPILRKLIQPTNTRARVYASDGTLIVDTAGRLHTKSNLMDELKKVRRILERELPGSPHETLLVLDATTGQNALVQARMFHQAVGITGIVLTKLDGTPKGGIVFAITRELSLPVKFIGVGEGIEDLREFDAREFVEALL